MRILFNSREPEFKTPFGTLVPEQVCTLRVHVPASVQAEFLTCELLYEDHSAAQSVKLTKKNTQGAYHIFEGAFTLNIPALYFYYFRVHTPDSCFRLFKQGDDTNMEAGDLWQVSCVPATFHTPDWAKGALI